jgi:hypothetical protein
MWMLHDEVKLSTWSREEFVYVNVTWSETNNMKSRGNCICEWYMKWNYWIWSQEEIVYVNDTWSETINMKSRGHCLCECHMKLNY